jgi:hypothetical protein
MEMYDFGPQRRPSTPAASDVFDATPLVTAAISQLKLGC